MENSTPTYMGTIVKKTILAWCAIAITSLAGAQTIEYKWLNQGCASVISCEDGCTACNVPENASSGFFGTNTIWIGTPICPYPTSLGDNSIFSSEWPMFPSSGVYGMLSGIATTPMQVDSIIIRHARTSSGPHRLKVSYSANPMAPFVEVADEYVDWNFQTTVITDLGCLEIPAGAPYATFQLKFQAYEPTGEGSWVVDEIRIVGSPCSTFSTGITLQRDEQRTNEQRPYVDVLGRPVVGSEAAPGVYLGGRRRVVTVF
jgi:hypothetical protein